MSSLESAQISYALKNKDIQNISEVIEKWEALSWKGSFSASSGMPKLVSYLQEYFGDEPKPYLKVSEDEKIHRVRMFMAFVRNIASFKVEHTDGRVAFKCLSRSISRIDKERGIPVGGFGNDSGFVNLLFQQIAKNVEEFPYTNQQTMLPWSHIVAASMGVSLFNDSSSYVPVGSFWHLKAPTASFGTVNFFNDDGLVEVPNIMQLNPEHSRYNYQMPLGLTEPGVYLQTLEKFLSLVSHCVKNESNQTFKNPLKFLQEQFLHLNNLEKVTESIQEIMMDLLENSFNSQNLLDVNKNLVNRFHPMGTTVLNIFSQMDRSDWSQSMVQRLINVCTNIKSFESSLNEVDSKYLLFLREFKNDLFPKKELIQYYISEHPTFEVSNKVSIDSTRKGLSL